MHIEQEQAVLKFELDQVGQIDPLEAKLVNVLPVIDKLSYGQLYLPYCFLIDDFKFILWKVLILDFVDCAVPPDEHNEIVSQINGDIWFILLIEGIIIILIIAYLQLQPGEFNLVLNPNIILHDVAAFDGAITCL